MGTRPRPGRAGARDDANQARSVDLFRSEPPAGCKATPSFDADEASPEPAWHRAPRRAVRRSRHAASRGGVMPPRSAPGMAVSLLGVPSAYAANGCRHRHRRATLRRWRRLGIERRDRPRSADRTAKGGGTGIRPPRRVAVVPVVVEADMRDPIRGRWNGPATWHDCRWDRTREIRLGPSDPRGETRDKVPPRGPFYPRGPMEASVTSAVAVRTPGPPTARTRRHRSPAPPGGGPARPGHGQGPQRAATRRRAFGAGRRAGTAAPLPAGRSQSRAGCFQQRRGIRMPDDPRNRASSTDMRPRNRPEDAPSMRRALSRAGGVAPFA